MDRVTDSLLNEFSAEHGIAHLAEDKRFEYFAAFITTKKHYPQSFSTSDLVTGKGFDTGVDSIAIIVNGELITDVGEIRELANRTTDLDVTFIFVQAETSSSFEAAKIGTFGFGVADFFKEIPSLQRNDRIENAAEIQTEIYKLSSKFRRHLPLCRMYYVTTGTWVEQPSFTARIEGIKNDLKDTGLFRSIEFIPLGKDGTQNLYRQTKNAISREFFFVKKTALPEMPGVKEAYLGYLPALEYLQIIRDDSGEIARGLFYDNVRDWLDSNDVNDEIMNTIGSPSKSRFALMNNGITIIARTCIPTGDKIYIENFSVVNGCQTSHSLHERSNDLDSGVMVPIRLISTQDEGVINDIIRATNRQTPITPEQFFALEEFPKQLEAFFATFDPSQKLYYERRTQQYDLSSIEKTRIISPANMVKAFAAMFLGEPHRATKDYGGLKAQVGKDIFVKSHRMEPYYTAAWALYKLEFYFRTQRLESALKPARFQILYVLRILLNPGQMPWPTSHDMKRVCNRMLDVLWESTKSDEIIHRAARIVRMSAEGLDRNSLRTQEFTEKVQEVLGNQEAASRDWHRETPTSLEDLL